MRTAIFNEANGDRLDIPNVAILITDGIPSREVDLLRDEVRLIRSLSIRIIGVGITDRVSECATAMTLSSLCVHRHSNVNLRLV